MTLKEEDVAVLNMQSPDKRTVQTLITFNLKYMMMTLCCHWRPLK